MSAPATASARLTTGQLAAELGADLAGPAGTVITGAEAIEFAGPGQIVFIRSAKFAKAWPTCKADAVLLTRGIQLPPGGSPNRAVLTVPDADLAMSHVLRLLMPPAPAAEPGVHSTAVVSPSATIDPTSCIGPLASIGAGSVIGPGAIIHAGARIGAHVRIGRATVLHANAVVQDRCVIGERSILHSGSVIGADGFGYTVDPSRGMLVKIPHIGNVEIGNDVEIGAGSCIDRGKFGATTIGDGTKIDNLVQIGHNCRVGRSCVICGCAALSGSVTLGDGVMMGGGSGVADNITVNSGARIAAYSGVMSDVPAGETFTGAPAIPHREWARQTVAFRRLTEQRPAKG
jgi:UDP-3-O-[3-hydroxymyristoyl] glucosamine N-acyltransferase